MKLRSLEWTEIVACWEVVNAEGLFDAMLVSLA